MNQIFLWLFLPIVSVISLPPEYDAKHREMHNLPNEFWSHHFGPDFQHAVHFDLKQTDLIETGANMIEKHLSESKDGNKKRSTYTIHKPQNHGQESRGTGSSMRVHLLQPDEIEALEKEMVNYAKGNKMAESPVVVNLPASEGSSPKNVDHEKPVVLNIPPVVYHGNANFVQSHHSESAKNAWSHNSKYNSYDSLPKVQSPFDFDRPSSNGEERQMSFEGANLSSFENKKPAFEEPRQASYEDKSSPLYEDGQESTDGGQDKTA